MSKVVILGCHPLQDCLTRQYKSRGCHVDSLPLARAGDIDIDACDELFMLADIESPNPVEADYEAVAMVGRIADKVQHPPHGKGSITCHLMLQSQKVLHMMQTSDFCKMVRSRMDVYPFTMASLWSECIRLDHVPINYLSEKHAHLVIFGMNEISEMVAVKAALMAHYPNYVRNHMLRTRITIVDEHAGDHCNSFVKRYQHLFDNSYYRVVKPSEAKAVTMFHKPVYEGLREDFVDVEWEFVEAGVNDTEIRYKLKRWSADDGQLLTVVMADTNGSKNVCDALMLPDDLMERHTPVYVYSPQKVDLDSFQDIHFFGMLDSGYDVSLPLVRMAKNVNYIYDRCYEENIAAGNALPGAMQSNDGNPFINDDTLRYAVEIDFDEREKSWRRLSSVKRMSSIYNAMTIATKMRSVGLEEDEWGKFYDISQEDIELLAQVEHNRWCVEELILGYRPCDDEEQEMVELDIKQKRVLKGNMIHYDLRAYDDLRPDETGKSSKVYDLCLCSCLPLIAKAFADETSKCERTNSKVD